MDNLKAMQQKHEGKLKKQMKPPSGMQDVCKGHGAEEKGETKKGGKR
jgi:hypothetical protein